MVSESLQVLGKDPLIGRDSFILFPECSGKISHKLLKICGAALLAASIIFITIGALCISGSASLWLFIPGGIFGALSLVIFAEFIIAMCCARMAAEEYIPLPPEEKAPSIPQADLTAVVAKEDISEPEPQQPATVATITAPEVVASIDYSDIPPLSRATKIAYTRSKKALQAYDIQRLPQFSWDNYCLISPQSPKFTDMYVFASELMRRWRLSVNEFRGRSYYPVQLRHPSGDKEQWRAFSLFIRAIEAAAVVSERTLLETPFFIGKEPQLNSVADVLSSPGLFIDKTFFMLPRAYYTIRFLHENSLEPLSDEEKSEAVAQFYTPGTPQHYFRTLYNDFCSRARWYLRDLNIEEDSTYQDRLIYSQEDVHPEFQNPSSFQRL
ncbi:hypothetical protein [Chlamydia vaughanii]|uniref:hypothetical protein n=1 Tax=Chlamydia vaughanii TaxID=3112552 RepID=UPI0032B14AD8